MSGLGKRERMGLYGTIDMIHFSLLQEVLAIAILRKLE